MSFKLLLISKVICHRVFTFIVGIQFWHICLSGTFPFLPYSHTLFVFLSPIHSSIYLSLSLPLLSLSLSLFKSLPSLSHTLLISLSLSLPILSASFPHFLSSLLRLFNLFNDHSPSPLSQMTDILTHYAFCVRNAL